MGTILGRIARRVVRLLTGDPIEQMKKGGLKVGRNLSLQPEVIIDPSHYWHIRIGDDVTLAPRVLVLAHDASIKRSLNYARIGKVRIGDRVFIGAGSIILPGVSIGDDVIIGAGSVVSRDIPSGVVAAGNPAQVIGPIDEFLARHRKQMETYPCFGEEYTVRQNVSLAMKQEMNERMEDGIGYIV
jgi:maltose O-acetyltransferase